MADISTPIPPHPPTVPSVTENHDDRDHDPIHLVGLLLLTAIILCPLASCLG